MTFRRVEPHLYADTPIFRTMLYERDGRFPGTPEGEEPIEVPEVVHVPVPIPDSPGDTMVNRLIPVMPLGVKAVFPIASDEDIERDSERTQPMEIPVMAD